MKRIKTQILAKLAIVILLLLGWIFSAKLIIDYLNRALKVNPAMVESYRPYLNVSLVKKAAQFLENKSAGLEELVSQGENLNSPTPTPTPTPFIPEEGI